MSGCRLLVVVNNFPPDRGGGAAVIGDLCYALAARGFEITVRCAYPYYPEWQDKSGRNGWSVWRYEDHGVRVERHGIYIPSNPNSLVQRLVHELSFLMSLLRSLTRGGRFDMVMAYCPAVSCLVFAAINRLVWRKPLWLNVQDLAADAAVASGLVTEGWLGRSLHAVQGWFFNRADVWSTISPVMAWRMAPMRRRAQPLLMLPNWLNESLRAEIDAQAPPKRVLHRPLRLLYAGNIGRKQNLLGLLKYLQASAVPFEFIVHGSGAQASAVEQWVSASGDARFRFGPFLDEHGFAGVLHWTDFFVITETEDSGASFMPSKLIPGIHSGAPVLAVCDADGPLGSEVRGHGLGPWFCWHDAASIAPLLAAVDADSYAAWSGNCRRRAAEYTRDIIITHFAKGLASMAIGQRPVEAVS